MSSTAELNCISIVEPFIKAATMPGMPEIQLMGGVGSAALRDPGTIIKTEERRVIAPPGLTLPQYRPDGNLRDVEVLVKSSRSNDALRVEACLAEHVGGQLVKEVFGFGDIAKADELTAAPFGIAALRTFVSDRYASADSSRVERMLFPFKTAIDPVALQTWTLEIGSLEVPIPSPAAVIINYLTRSISGLRPKDAEKVFAMADRILTESPELREWIYDGPGNGQFTMARVLQTLRHANDGPFLSVGDHLKVCPLPGDLTEHRQFMLGGASSFVQRRSLQWAVIKSRGLGKAESFEGAVTFFQKHLEARAHSIVHNS